MFYAYECKFINLKLIFQAVELLFYFEESQKIILLSICNFYELKYEGSLFDDIAHIFYDYIYSSTMNI